MPPAGEAPTALNFGVWAVNHILLYRAGSNNLASQLNVIPRSETRLRDEGIIPFYSLLRDITSTLKSSARERGVTVPPIPDAPEDWKKEAATDYKALAAQFRPRLAEPAKATMDWILGSRDRDPKLHWASRVAVSSVSLNLFIEMMPAMGETMGGGEWDSFVAQVTSNEFRRTAGIINEEILRIRAQPESGWDEEEAKRVVKEQLGYRKKTMKVGT